jgi:hypothetical protein
MFNATLEQRHLRKDAMSAFEHARTMAHWHWLWTVLTRQAGYLLAFDAIEKWIPRQRLYQGIHEVPLDDIVGSVNRSHEFNRRFHPLRDTLAERWVNVMVLAHTTGWEPIQLYKVGNLYFVEDGHHRVSVARWLKNSAIEAEVWAYPLGTQFTPTAATETILAQLKDRPEFVEATAICNHALCG